MVQLSQKKIYALLPLLIYTFLLAVIWIETNLDKLDMLQM